METTTNIDPDTINAGTEVRCIPEGTIMRFMLKGESATIVAEYVEGAIKLFPERDVGHRKLRDALAL